MPSSNILILDDEVNNLNALKRTCGSEYNVFLATNGKDALSIMEQNDIALIIAEYRILSTTGIEFTERVLQEYPNTVRIVLTEHSDEKQLIDAISMGHIHSYITKPWEPEEIRTTVKEQLDYASRLQGAGKKMLGELLIWHDIISEDQLETALEVQRSEKLNRRKLGEILVNLGYTDEESIVSCYALQLGMPYISLSQFHSKLEVVKLLPSTLAYRYAIIPIDSVGRVLVVATSEPLSDVARIEVEERTGYKIMTVCTLLRDIKAALEKYYPDQIPIESKPMNQ